MIHVSSVARRASFAGRDVRATLGLGVAQAQPDLAGQHAGQHHAGRVPATPNCCTIRATIAVVPQWYQGVWARAISS